LPHLTNHQREVRDHVRRFANEHVAPRAAQTDATGAFDWELVERMREHGILGLPVPGEYGGTGRGGFAFLLAVAEIAKVCATTALTLSMQQLGSLPVKLAGTDEQKRRWLPRLGSGEWLPAYALTEREAGSDPSALRTRARRDNGNYVLEGRKCFISNAGVASLYTVFAKTDPDAGAAGISAFVVEADTPGCSIGRLERKMGLRGQPTGDLVFHECVLPASNRLGGEGEGFHLAMRVLDYSRPGIAAQSVGLAEGATDYALEYAKKRHSFGRPIIDHQLIAGQLADMEAKCAAARALLHECGALLDHEDAGRELTKVASITKLFCSDVAMEVTTSAVQILGGNGYVQDYPVERMMRDAKVTQIYEGTNEIQRVVIARRMAVEPRIAAHEPLRPLGFDLEEDSWRK
jgi:alkylation response protein AidB-like acyl-CoA dehydrogenase